MHQYNVGAPFKRIAIDVAGLFPLSNQGDRYLLIAMGYFMKWPEAYAIPNQEASTIKEALVTNFCCFCIPQELHSAHVAQLVEHLYDIHNYKLPSDWMKARYDKLANSTGYQEGDSVWLYCPTRTKGKSPKLQSSWEGPYKIVTRINVVVYRIKNPRSRMMVVHLDRLVPYQGAAWDKHT
jgi:hypothetical protein